MEQKKRLCDWMDTIYHRIQVKRLITIISTIFIFITVGLTFFYLKYPPKFIDYDWKSSYDEVEERYYFLEKIAEDTIIIGVTIDVKNIPTDVQYRITPDKDHNIIYYYVLPSSDTYSFDTEMTILLSENMEILSKDCSITLDSKEYQRNYTIVNYLVTVLYSFCLSLAILFVFLLLLLFVYMISKFRQIDNQNNVATNSKKDF